jgi:hypothetical protein
VTRCHGVSLDDVSQCRGALFRAVGDRGLAVWVRSGGSSTLNARMKEDESDNDACNWIESPQLNFI